MGFSWGRDEPEITLVDPFSHPGAGGKVTLRWKEQAALEARAAEVAPFKAKL